MESRTRNLTAPVPARVALPAAVWRERELAHRARVAPFAEAFLRRRSCGEKHPVWDFLFTYYSFSPAKLVTWCPAIFEPDPAGSIEDGAEDARLWEWPPLTARLEREAVWVARLCGNVMSRPARFVCHGLHEWAMVYRQDPGQVRHPAWKLRLPPDELAGFVESQAVCCTHYDAYRFFTPDARPLNAHEPRLETRLEMEQGGCLHTNMDLYKWAGKLWPWIGSNIVADALEIAAAGRALDMRASPYDLAELGFAPVRVETEEGRAEYRAGQQRLASLAEPVRLRLREAALRIAAAAVS